MNIVTGREFRFSFFLNDPASVEHEYGAMIKTVFEVTTEEVPDANIIWNTQIFPFRGLMPFGYSGPNVSALATLIPVLKFHYLGISTFPQATGARAIAAGGNPSLSWYWTAGNALGLTDVIWINTGFFILGNGGNPAALAGGFPVTSILGGMIAEIDAVTVHRPLGAKGGTYYFNSFIFPPIDVSITATPPIPPDGSSGLVNATTLLAQEYDGFPFLNLRYQVGAGGVGSSVSAGVWRFVHLFSETTR